MHTGQEIRLFGDSDGFQFFEGRKHQVLGAVGAQSDDYILNVNREDFLDYLEAEYSLQPIRLLEDELSVSTHTEYIPAERHPFSYLVDEGRSYKRDVIRYHLPFEADTQLLKVQPSSWLSYHPRAYLDDGLISFDVINFNLTPDEVRRKAQETLGPIKTLTENLNRDIESFNKWIRPNAAQAFDQKKDEIMKKRDLVAALGVPVKKAADVPETFSVPVRRTPAIAKTPKPEVLDRGFRPEPSLDDSIYQQILKILHDVGKQFERLPSTYANKDEEALRDHILLFLEPNFEGSATGETFNKTGKTDILMRHEGKNVFVAELKIWRGQKAFLETISQLLGYLTWRDSKAAVIMFVHNKQFSPVLESIVIEAPKHPNFLRHVREVEPGWNDYIFHIPGDRNREVRVAIMAFHLSGPDK
jgi:hypothetical protein